MRNYRKLIRRISYRLLLFAVIGCFSSCGTVRTYGGIEHEYEYDFDGGKHHKHKKHKHKKAKKFWKHHKHHD